MMNKGNMSFEQFLDSIKGARTTHVNSYTERLDESSFSTISQNQQKSSFCLEHVHANVHDFADSVP